MARGLIALAVIVALVVIVVALGSSKSSGDKPTPPATPNTPGTPATPGTPGTPSAVTPAVVTPVKIVIECEKPTKLEDKAPDGTVVMRIASVHMGKAMGYLEIPDGWMHSCGLDTTELKTGGGKLPGKAIYEFEVPREDEYYVFLRAKWFDSCGDSVFLKLDDQPYLDLRDDEGKISESEFKWAWHPYKDAAKMKAFKLAKGKHTFELNTKEDGPQFDKILIATDANSPAEDEVDP
ncbi:MAG: hypothetical protein KIS92_00690 [Planctomycetota bacterium]|nr:hypothetical protein [Planctomycetota bacterium]